MMAAYGHNRRQPYFNPRSTPSRKKPPKRPTAVSSSRNSQPLREIQGGELHQVYKPGMGLGDLANHIAQGFSEDEADREFDMNHSHPFPESENLHPMHPSETGSYSMNQEIMDMLHQQQALLQEQQGLMQKVLRSQESMSARQDDIASRQDMLEETVSSWKEKLEKFNNSSSPSSSSDGKRKRVVTRTLSNKVYSVHKELEPQEQFSKNESFSSSHNKVVQQTIITEIIGQPDCKFSDSEVKVAVRRCYENLRRTFLEQQSGKEEFVESQSKRRKYRSRRERKFQRRTSVVNKSEMEKYWKHLSIAYVTEESDDPDNPNGLIEHKIPWRSDKLNEFMELLDVRSAKKNLQPLGLVAKKVHKQGTPSDCLPPPDAPSWAVQKDAEPEHENTPTEL